LAVTASGPDEEVLFNAARHIRAGAARARYLREAAGGDEGLLRRVEALLAVHDAPDPLLDRPAGAGGLTGGCGPAVGDETVSILSHERAGTPIGPYKLLQQIGEGGMGVVWMAEQTQPVQRKVALKVIKPGMDSRLVVARFEAERQALALMDHVNIARVFDGGTTENGRPFFVMELVHGVPITRYCDDNRLTPRQRLELFVPVCQAIQHAHQKGIIHRDIKPSNVMITLYEGKPVPKVIDFGVAKAIGQQLTERTLCTQYGALVGTFEYMSPEQAEMSALGVDTRSDIYSLGVLLYELLTGSTPLTHKRMKEAAYAEILRMIKEEEPPKPSTRLSDSGEALASISANRHMEPAKLTKLVRGELDWIVMKTLEKDRNRRYETAKDFATDVQRYLADEPVLAGRPSTGYRLGKFIRRNRRPVLAASLLVLALVGGIVGTTWQAVRATRAHRQAEANRRKAHQAVNDYFTLVSESSLLQQPSLEPLRKQLLEKALRYYESFVEERADDPELQAELVATYLRIAVILNQSGSREDWLPAFQKAVSQMEDLMGQRPDIETMRSLRSGVYRVNTSSFPRFPDLDEALSTFERGCNVWERLVREHPTVPGFQNDLALAHFMRALLLFQKGRRAEVLGAHERSIALRQELVQTHPDRPDYRAALAVSQDGMDRALVALGRHGEAEQAGEQAIGLVTKLVADFPDVPAWQDLLSGRLYIRRGIRFEHAGRLEEAAQAYRQSLAGQEALLRDYPTVGRYRSAVFHVRLLVGRLLWATGRRAEAAEIYQLVRPLGEKLKPDNQEDQAELAWFLAACPDARFRDTRRSIDLAKKLVEGAPKNGHFWGILGAAYFGNGDWQEAVGALQKATQLPSSRSMASVSFLVRSSSSSVNAFYLAMACWKAEQKEQARKWYDQAAALMVKQPLWDKETRRLQAEAAAMLEIKN
jgi:serine/threonine protein kinase/Flp pilus assembly protein TadD